MTLFFMTHYSQKILPLDTNAKPIPVYNRIVRPEDSLQKILLKIRNVPVPAPILPTQSRTIFHAGMLERINGPITNCESCGK